MKQSNLTVKGQVTIPKDVRDALGLKAGHPVEFDWNDRGEAVIRAGNSDFNYRRRFEAAGRRLAEVQQKYRHLRTGRRTDDIMRELRGDDPLP